MRRDRRELRNVEALLKGKREDARKRVADLIKEAARKERQRREAEAAARAEGKGRGKGGWGATLAGARGACEAGEKRRSVRKRVVSVFAAPPSIHAGSPTLD